jgi:hypothetical protein
MTTGRLPLPFRHLLTDDLFGPIPLDAANREG